MSSSTSVGCTLRFLRNSRKSCHSFRAFATTTPRPDEATLQTTSSPTPPPLDPSLVSTRREERQLIRTGLQPIGSRRRRAALQSSQNIPFEELPYQCFQEARKVLLADREEKLRLIEAERRRIASVQSRDAADFGGEYVKKGKLVAMQKHLADLKILADINDPVIRKRFEDGHGDMTRPIYRHLADKKWRSYARPVIMQRISQFHLVPDLLPHLEPTASITMAFGRRNVAPGEFVDSRVSEIPLRLNVQVYDQGERLVTIVVMDGDVPNTATDRFDHRCHFLAANIPLTPDKPSVPLAHLDTTSQVVLPWLPPHAVKGSPYHRLAVFVLEQADKQPVNIEKMKEGFTEENRLGFGLRAFLDRYREKAVGATLFRNVWDEGTDGVMRRRGLEGASVELKRRKPEKAPYKKKDGERYR